MPQTRRNWARSGQASGVLIVSRHPRAAHHPSGLASARGHAPTDGRRADRFGILHGLRPASDQFRFRLSDNTDSLVRLFRIPHSLPDRRHVVVIRHSYTSQRRRFVVSTTRETDGYPATPSPTSQSADQSASEILASYSGEWLHLHTSGD